MHERYTKKNVAIKVWGERLGWHTSAQLGLQEKFHEEFELAAQAVKDLPNLLHSEKAQVRVCEVLGSCQDDVGGAGRLEPTASARAVSSHPG